jgi:hypothetical protein
MKPAPSPGKSPSSVMTEILLRRIRRAAGKERWGRAFLQIAWTAGPVTYLGLQSGYYIAYGSAAPPNVFLYFAGYTLVAGVFALVARFLYNASRGESRDADSQALEFVFDALPQRVIEIRNMQLEELDPYGSKILGTKYLLENPRAGADALATAVWDLLGDAELAEGARRLEIYRSNGLHYRAREISESLEKLLDPHQEILKSVSESLASMLMRRITFDRDDHRAGRIRTRGFLSRCYAAADRDDLNQMTLADAEEVCILIFEIINRRAFPRFKTEYRGPVRFVEAARNLERARSEYRAAIYRRNDGIRVLAEALYTPIGQINPLKPGFFLKAAKKRGAGIHRVLASIPEIRSARTLQERIIEALATRLSGPEKNSAETREFVKLYRQLQRQSRVAAESYSRFRRAWQRMHGLFGDAGPYSGQQLYLHTSSLGRDKRKTGVPSVSLIPSTISLDDRRILPFARKIYEKLSEFEDQIPDHGIRRNDQKELAIDLLLLADEFLPLEQNGVQRAIERTPSAYISRSDMLRSGSPGSSWGLAPVSDQLYPAKEALQEVLENLIRFEGLVLSDDDIEFCVDRFGADPEALEELSRLHARGGKSDFDLAEPMILPAIETISR